MRRYAYKKYLIIAAALFLILSLPTLFIEKIRGGVIHLAASLFKIANLGINHKVNGQDHLEAENHLLRLEIGKLRALLEQQVKVIEYNNQLQCPSLSARRYEEMKYLSALDGQTIPARVIYRDPGSWSSALWVNVGEETNKVMKKEIIQKNSPVILGRAVVGVVDYVGKKQSRIRLITDSALKPSVRAVRGFPQYLALIEHIDPLLKYTDSKVDAHLSAEEKTLFIKTLEKLRAKFLANTEGWYLAKGILQGSGAPLWRSANHILRGIGFNYDFPDEEGPARELMTGNSLEAKQNTPPLPLIQMNDLLVTTGMDGVFPPGLRVARVTKIYPLREGAYTYEIEAAPIIGNLDSLQTIFIIPPIGYDKDVGEEDM